MLCDDAAYDVMRLPSKNRFNLDLKTKSLYLSGIESFIEEIIFNVAYDINIEKYIECKNYLQPFHHRTQLITALISDL